MQFKICYREEFNKCKIHRMDKICLELGPFEEFANAVLYTNFGHQRQERFIMQSLFFNHVNETNGASNGLKKSHFEGRLRSIVKLQSQGSRHIYSGPELLFLH